MLLWKQPLFSRALEFSQALVHLLFQSRNILNKFTTPVVSLLSYIGLLISLAKQLGSPRELYRVSPTPHIWSSRHRRFDPPHLFLLSFAPARYTYRDPTPKLNSALLPPRPPGYRPSLNRKSHRLCLCMLHPRNLHPPIRKSA